MNPILIGNIVTFLGSILMVAVGFVKSRKNILLTQCAQFGIMGLGNLILGGIPGFVANILSILRNLFCLKRELTLGLGLGFVAVQTALTLAVNTMGALGWLPVIAAAVYTLSINAKNEIPLKAAIIVGQLCWLSYDLAICNYATVLFDVFAALSNTWGILLILRARKKAV